MAKILEEIITIKISKLVKNHEHHTELVSSDVMQTLEQVISELVGDTLIVEVGRE